MSRAKGALRASVREELQAVGFIPTASKLYRPAPGIVARRTLVERVAAGRGDVITVTAPAGYGKSTFVAELTAADPRPTAWVSLSSTENDPASLLTYVALAIDDIEPVDPACVAALWRRSPTIGSPALQRFGAMLASRRRPFVLVLDDVHELSGRAALDVLPVLISELPPGSTLALLGRAAIPVPFGRVRVRRRLIEVGPADLAFDTVEAADLFARLDVGVPEPQTGRLVERAEGWPVALYLAALAQGTGRVPASDLVEEFHGDHRYLVDYLGEELLGELDDDVATFLMEASCFERMSGILCDDVLGRHGSALLLDDLQRQNLLVVPLDDRRTWYRFHHLMAEFLQAELSRRDPGRRAEIHRRASEWYHHRGDADRAIAHAVLSGDLDHAQSMVMHWFGRVAASGLYPTIERWLAMFSPEELAASPGLMITAAHGRFRAGEGGAAVQWLDRAAAVLPERHPQDAQGAVPPVLLAVARAIIVPMGPDEMMAEARYTYEHAQFGEGHPLACLAWGAAAFMAGDEEEAVRRLRECVDSPLHRPLVKASALSHLAVIDVEHGRWDEATAAARRARALLGPSIRLPPGNLVLAMNVLVSTHGGKGGDVEADRQRCRQHLVDLLDTAAWVNLQARVALVRDALLRGDRVEASALLDEADAILETAPGATRVASQLAALRREATSRDRTLTFGPASLTTAELRVLQLLPTHLSVAEIADRLYVSRNTVKSQTIAIYRKLGTSSRGGAVEIAIGAGLLDAAGRA